MDAQVQLNAPAFPDEEALLEELRGLGAPQEGPPFSVVAIAYEGAKIRVLVACHTDEEDVAVRSLLEKLGLIDLLTPSPEVDAAIGAAVASGIRTVLGGRWDSLYVRKPRPTGAA